MQRITFSILILSLLLFSCRSKKPVTDTGAGTKERSANFIMKKMISNQVDADWMTGKMKLNVKSEALTMGLSGNIRMEKDKAIWMNVKKFGFEVARVLIEPDSVFVIDRINGERIAEDLSYVQKTMNFPANFEMLQAIMLGNPVFFTKNFEIENDSTGYKLYSEASTPRSNYFLSSRDFSIERMVFDEVNPQRFMEITQGKYQTAGKNGNFPYFRTFDVDSKETGKVNLKIEFSNVEFDVPKSMPFKK